LLLFTLEVIFYVSVTYSFRSSATESGPITQVRVDNFLMFLVPLDRTLNRL